MFGPRSRDPASMAGALDCWRVDGDMVAVGSRWRSLAGGRMFTDLPN
jgi:hypothetical protein